MDRRYRGDEGHEALPERLPDPPHDAERHRFARHAASQAGESAAPDFEQRLRSVEKQLSEAAQAEKKAADQAAQKFSTKIFGRINLDAASFSQDAANRALLGNIQNGFNVRRLRLGVMGEGFEVFAYRLDVDFVTNDAATLKRPTVFDVYFDVRQLPLLGSVRVGHFREPFSLERLDSTNDLPFLERSLAVNTFAPFRNLGVMAFDRNVDQTMTWAYGAFRENTNEFGEELGDGNAQALTGRMTWSPWYDDTSGGRYLLHFGASYSYRDARRRQRRFAQTPEVILHEDLISTQRFVDTGVIPAESNQILGLEASTVLGPVSLQGEYLCTFVDQLRSANLFFQGLYLQSTWFLTGESRNYDRSQGIYQAVTPYSNFFRVTSDRRVCTSWGAWEAVMRYSWLDLDSQNVRAGNLQDMTLGLNWYLAPRTRVMFNYIHAFLDRNQTNSNADIVSTRLQIVF